MSYQSKTQNWYASSTTPGAGFEQRKKSIARYRSPSTIADEIFRILTWGVQPLLLVFCMALSYFSYEAFFAHNFSPGFAMAGALILSVVIELGKIKIGGYVFQVPFLSGVQLLRSSFPAFAVWGGALILTVVTFYMSVNNSTKGAAMLAQKAGFEKNERSFTPNTAEIDAQIEQANGRIVAANSVKWKGVVTYQSQKAIQSAEKSITALQAQREEAIRTQRADFERQRAQIDSNTSNGATILMASGGWVEALQVICLFLVAACMATIDKVMGSTPTPSPASQGINFQGNGAGNKSQAPYNEVNPGQIGFRWKGYGTQSTRNPEPVPQSPQPVPQLSQAVLGCDQILLSLRKKLQSELPNLTNKNGQKSSISARINRAFDEAYQAMNLPDFVPSREVGAKVYKYLVEEAIPTLNGVGWPYEKDSMFLKRLLHVIPQFSRHPAA